MRKLLPIGTYVKYTPKIEGRRARRALVHGYDMGRTKYELTTEMWKGHFATPGGVWAFPDEVEEIILSQEIAEVLLHELVIKPLLPLMDQVNLDLWNTLLTEEGREQLISKARTLIALVDTWPGPSHD